MRRRDNEEAAEQAGCGINNRGETGVIERQWWAGSMGGSDRAQSPRDCCE